MVCTATAKFIQIYETSVNDAVLTACTDSWFRKDYELRLAIVDLGIESEKVTLWCQID